MKNGSLNVRTEKWQEKLLKSLGTKTEAFNFIMEFVYENKGLFMKWVKEKRANKFK